MTPSCVLTDQLDAFLDGDLAPRAAGQFEAHAAACPACAEELALARRLQGTLRALPEEPCPYDVFQGALDRIAREGKDRPALTSRARRAGTRLPRWQVAGAGVALVALLAFAFVLLRPEAELAPGERVAVVEPSDPTPAVVAPPVAESVAPVEEDTLVAPAPAPPVERAAPARVRAPRSSPAPAAAPRADVAEAAPSPAPSEAAPSEAEVADARAGVRLAFALFADANRQATEAVRANVGQGIGHVTDAFAILR